MKWIAPVLATLAVSVALAHPPSHPNIPAYVVAAVADPARSEDSKLDVRRHAADLVAFSEVKPGDRVLEIIPGKGYFTRVFSKVVGPKGTVYAALPAEIEKLHPGADTMHDLGSRATATSRCCCSPPRR